MVWSRLNPVRLNYISANEQYFSFTTNQHNHQYKAKFKHKWTWAATTFGQCFGLSCQRSFATHGANFWRQIKALAKTLSRFSPIHCWCGKSQNLLNVLIVTASNIQDPNLLTLCYIVTTPFVLNWKLFYFLRQTSLVLTSLWKNINININIICYSSLMGGPFLFICFAEAYDSLDPNGNITIKWDVMQWTPDGYVVSSTPTPIVSLFIFKFDLVTLADLSYWITRPVLAISTVQIMQHY
jgi:hypothetical protein